MVGVTSVVRRIILKDPASTISNEPPVSIKIPHLDAMHLDEDDDFFGGGDGDAMAGADMKVMHARLFHAGFQEGIEKGKAASLQSGFDHGFNIAFAMSYDTSLHTQFKTALRGHLAYKHKDVGALAAKLEKALVPKNSVYASLADGLKVPAASALAVKIYTSEICSGGCDCAKPELGGLCDGSRCCADGESSTTVEAARTGESCGGGGVAAAP